MLKRLTLLTVLLASLVALVPATASAATCWKELVNDYWADNRVDRTYPISCYREAMEKLPTRRAGVLGRAGRPPPRPPRRDSRRARQRRQRVRRGRPERGSAAGPADDDEGPKGFFSEVLDKLGPKNADSIPVPLLVLGSIALLLMGAAGVSYLARYLQARRLDVPEPRP